MAKANFTYQRVGDAKIDLAMQQVSQAFARVDQADVMIVAEINQAMYSAAGNESLIVANRTCKITLPTPTGLWSVTIVQGSKANSVTVTTASATVALDGSTPGSVTLSEVATSVQIVTDGTAYYVVGSQAAPAPPPPPVPPGPPFGPPVGPPGPPSIPTGPAGGDLTGTYPNPLVGPNKVTYAKIQQVGAGAMLGNPTGSPADVEEITLGNGIGFFFPAPGVQQIENTSALFMLTVSPPLSFDGVSVLASLFDNVSLTLTGGNALQRAALTGDVTAAAGSNATTIAAHAVTYGKIQTETPGTILGNPTGSPASPQEIFIGGGLDIATGPFALERSHITGDVDVPAGSNTATLATVATAGTYTSVTVNAKGLVTSGTNPPRSMAINYDFFGLSSGSGWLVTGNDSSVKTFGGFAVEYPLGQAFLSCRLRVINGVNSGSGYTALNLTITRNGSATLATVAIPASSATVAFDSGDVAIAGGAATDTYGVELTYTGATVPAGTTDFTVTAVFQ